MKGKGYMHFQFGTKKNEIFITQPGITKKSLKIIHVHRASVQKAKSENAQKFLDMYT